MDRSLQDETERLKLSWAQYDPALLKDYLVSQVEDPRLNLQSILTRHFLLHNLFGDRFYGLEGAEICFALAANWLQKFFREYPSPEDAQALLHALSIKSDNADGIEVPYFLSEIFSRLPASINGVLVLNYIQQALQSASKDGLTEECKGQFKKLWRQKLGRSRPKDVRVLEPACGSANDYRFIHEYGLGRLIQYTGFDLCDNNVANARKMFPAIDFKIGNVLEIDAPDKSFDLCLVHDLFEHLSVNALEKAVSEICRVTKGAICAGFFNMAETEEHLVQPTENYHWNRLSMERTKRLFLMHCKEVQVLHIGTYLRQGFPQVSTHNENAYTFVVRF
jgi:ubiquinone/menaquinone biosynthesis C-methylase UbiE